MNRIPVEFLKLKEETKNLREATRLLWLGIMFLTISQTVSFIASLIN